MDRNVDQKLHDVKSLHVQGLSPTEIATRLRIDVDAVRRDLEEIRKQQIAALRQIGREPEVWIVGQCERWERLRRSAVAEAMELLDRGEVRRALKMAKLAAEATVAQHRLFGER